MLFDPVLSNFLLGSVFSFAVSLFLWAGWTDIRTMKIPNLVSLGLIIAWGLRALVMPATVDLIWDPVFALIIFVPFFLLYSFGNGGFGAGDVKLITTGTLWFGTSLSNFDIEDIGAPNSSILTMASIFLITLALSGLVQSVFTVIYNKMITNKTKEKKPGLLSGWFKLFKPQEDGKVYVSAALAVGMNSALENAVGMTGALKDIRQTDGKLHIPYGPSIVSGALFAFCAQLFAWGII